MSRHTFFVGTRSESSEGGLYRIFYESISNVISEPVQIASFTGFSHVAFCSDRNLLGVTAVSSDNQDMFTTYWFDPKEENLELLGSVLLNAKHDMCHLNINHLGTQAIVTDFQDHAVHIIPINPNGIPQSKVQRIQFEGHGSSYRQDAAHPHSAFFSPDDSMILVSDLGSNSIWSLRKGNDNYYECIDRLLLDPSAGPRHLVLHPCKPVVYSISEISADVNVIKYNSNGQMSRIQKISAISEVDFHNGGELRPSGVPMIYMAGGDIVLSEDNKYLFTSIRGPHIISAFEVSEDGESLKYLSCTNQKGFVRVLHTSQRENLVFALGEEWRGDKGEFFVFSSMDPYRPMPLLNSILLKDAFVSSIKQ